MNVRYSAALFTAFALSLFSAAARAEGPCNAPATAPAPTTAATAPSPAPPGAAPAPSGTAPAPPSPANTGTVVPPAGTTPPASPAPSEAAPATALPNPNRPPAFMPPHLQPAWLSWDLNLEGAYGKYFPSDRHYEFFRGRGGLLYAVDPVFYALGLTYEWSNREPATFGIQGEVLQLELGVWAQAGVLMGTQLHPGGSLAVGWSIFGIESQIRKYDPDPYGIVLVGKIRIPVSFIALAFR